MVGCPKCGDTDIQVLELLAAWKEIDDLKNKLKGNINPLGFVALKDKLMDNTNPRGFIVPIEANLTLATEVSEAQPVIELTKEQQDWKTRYDKIKDAYIKTRLEVSGSFGNWDFQTRKRVLEHEISSELGFLI